MTVEWAAVVEVLKDIELSEVAREMEQTLT